VKAAEALPVVVTNPAPAPQQHATGGGITGVGHDTSDNIPILASPGEYMINAKSARAIGKPALDWLNSQGMASGGMVNRLMRAGRWLFDTGGDVGSGTVSLDELRDPTGEQAKRAREEAEKSRQDAAANRVGRWVDPLSAGRLDQAIMAENAQNYEDRIKQQRSEEQLGSRLAARNARISQKQHQSYAKWVKGHLHHRSASGLEAAFQHFASYDLLSKSSGEFATGGPITIGDIGPGRLGDVLSSRLSDPAPLRYAGGGDVGPAPMEPRTPIVLQFTDSGHEFELEAKGETIAKDLSEFSAERQTARGYDRPTWDK
jgi:hypothetical protein